MNNVYVILGDLPNTVYSQPTQSDRQANTRTHTYSRMTYGYKHMDVVTSKPHIYITTAY